MANKAFGKWARYWVACLVLVASTTAAAQTAGAPQAAPPSKGSDAAAPFGPPSPADNATAEAAAEAAAREQQARKALEEQRAREINQLRADLETLRNQQVEDRQVRAEAIDALNAQVDAFKSQSAQAPPNVLTARLGVSLTGYLQADWLVNNQSSQDQLSPSGAPLNLNEVFIRRARLRAAIDRPWVAGLVEFDGNTVNGPQARIIGAEASLKFPPERGDPLPLLMATIGMFKIPFGFEVGQSDRDRLFLERSTAEHGLFPGEYDAGIRVQGGWRFVRYVLAVMDGEPIGERTFPLHDPNSAKDFVGRVGIDTPIAPRVWVAGGFSGLSGTGFHAGTPATKATVVWNDANGNGTVQAGEITVVPGSAAVASQNFSRFGYGADLRLGVDVPSLGATVLWSELYWAKNLDRGILPADPVAFGRDYRELGLYAGVTQELGQHAQVGVRYDFYNPDADSVNTVMGATKPTAFAYQTLSFVAALRAPSGRLIAEYDINRNHNGRDLEGNPTNLADNAFTIRGEVSF
ncbi:MAG TPA: hypothetical protein VFG23_16150 [Polyangia bacterium]|nr:hypothetical protein [Polyangia bacterium]